MATLTLSAFGCQPDSMPRPCSCRAHGRDCTRTVMDPDTELSRINRSSAKREMSGSAAVWVVGLVQVIGEIEADRRMAFLIPACKRVRVRETTAVRHKLGDYGREGGNGGYRVRAGFAGGRGGWA